MSQTVIPSHNRKACIVFLNLYCMHAYTHTHTPFCRFLRYTAPVSVEPVSLDIANGKESSAGGEDEKTVEEVESTLVATPTST